MELSTSRERARASRASVFFLRFQQHTAREICVYVYIVVFSLSHNCKRFTFVHNANMCMRLLSDDARMSVYFCKRMRRLCDLCEIMYVFLLHYYFFLPVSIFSRNFVSSFSLISRGYYAPNGFYGSNSIRWDGWMNDVFMSSEQMQMQI